jgi:carboxymethylenebutenolidase
MIGKVGGNGWLWVGALLVVSAVEMSCGVSAGPPGGTTLTTEAVAFPGAQGQIKAYLARPSSTGTFPTLIIIHENRGLTDHIKDVARRFAAQGYAALAPDLLSRIGGKEKFVTDNESVQAITSLPPEGVQQDLQSAFGYMNSQSFVQPGHIGVIGYCWGGGNSLLMSTRNMGLRAAVVYYGPNPANLDDVARIACPVLGIYGEKDPRITVNMPALAEAMVKYNKSFEYKVYPGAMHAFFNDTGANYKADAAADAWKLTLAFLEKNLKQ